MESPPFPRHERGRGPKAPAPAGYSLETRTLVGPVVPAALAVSESTLASEQRDPLRVAVSGMAIIHAGMDSKADLFVAQMQDYLRLGAEARMNEPGTLKVENWRWRAERAQLTDRLAEEIADLTNAAGRV